MKRSEFENTSIISIVITLIIHYSDRWEYGVDVSILVVLNEWCVFAVDILSFLS